MKEILSSLESLFLEFNVRRFAFWLSLSIVVVVLLLFGESQTGFLFFWRLERKVSLLNDLQSLTQAGIIQNNQLGPIHDEIVAELTAYKVSSFQMHEVLAVEWFWKFVSGAFLGFAVAVAGFTGRGEGDEKWKSTVYGGIFLGAVLGIIGTLLPNIYSPWVNYLGYPVLQVVVILGAARLTRRAKAA